MKHLVHHLVHHSADPTGSPAADVADSPVTLVAIDDELDRLRTRLQQELGPSYLVVSSSLVAEPAVAVVPALVARIELVRAAHPRALIVAYDHAGNEPSPYFDARADDYVAQASMAELAARIRAGLRRLGWQRTDT